MHGMVHMNGCTWVEREIILGEAFPDVEQGFGTITLISFVQTGTVNKVGLVLLASCFFLKEFIRYFPATLGKDMIILV